MKKLILPALLLFTSCTCVLPQIPPQYVYVGETCEAPLPDYLPWVTATDNCALASLIQIPEPGTVLTSDNAVTPVEIRATDNTGNHTSVKFNVILIDTIPPIITVDDTTITTDNTLLDTGYDVLEALYTQAERIIADKLDFFDANFPYSKLGLPPQDSTYYREYLITTTYPGYARTGEGGRIWQFWNPTDSISQ